MADAKLVCAREELSYLIDNDGKLRVAHRTNAMEFSVKDVGVKFKSVVRVKGSSHPTMFYVIDTENYIWNNGPWDSVKDYHIFTYTTKKHEFKLHKIGVKAIDMDTCGDNTACINPEGKLLANDFEDKYPARLPILRKGNQASSPIRKKRRQFAESAII